MNAINIVSAAFSGVFLLLLNTVHVLRYLFVLYLTNLRFLKKLHIKQIMNVFIRAMVKNIFIR